MKSIPDTYTQFRKEVESKSKIRKVLDMPNSLKPIPPGLDVKSVPEFLDFNLHTCREQNLTIIDSKTKHKIKSKSIL